MTFNLNRRLGAALLGTTLLAACGGGDQVTKFAPTRVLAFGDETSFIEDVAGTGNGRKYSVNGLATDGVTIDCRVNPIWVQVVASGFGLVFPQCNTGATPVAAPASRIYAVPGARVADVVGQVDRHVASGGGFGGTDLATVLAGANDVLALYAQFPGVPEADLVAQAETAGSVLAQQVNRIADAGGKVVVSTAPDLGLSPYGIAQERLAPGRAALLTKLSARFNARLRVGVVNDGRRIGLMFTDEALQSVSKFASATGFTNVVAPVCDPVAAPVLTACTTATLVSGGSGTSWLWADATRLSAGGQTLLGNLGLSRAVNNPF